MKKIFIFLLLLSFIGSKVFAQSGACPVDISAIIVTVPTCGASNGAFNIQTGFRGSDPAQVSLDGFATWQDDAATPGTVHFTGMAAGTYTVSVRSSGNTGSICQTSTFTFVSSLYDTTAVLTPTAASGCFNTDGSIIVSGLTAPLTDSVSWLSNISPTFVTVASLGGTIGGLIPGHYYVVLKAAGSNYCYSTQKITVGNTGTACAAPTFCGNAADPTNLFPNGTFGSGGNADGTNAQVNGPALPVSETQYTYQKLGYRGPEDGFYAITNNTYLGTDYLHFDPTDPTYPVGNVNNNPNNTPFNGQWYNGYDHDFAVTGVKNGYQLVVNASYTPSIAIQQTVNNLCVNKKYQFSAWIRNLDMSVGLIPARVEFLVNGVGLYTTPIIPTGPTGQAWQQVGFTFQTNVSNATISIRNDTTGGFGNDWALDDIYIGDCQPSITLNPAGLICGSINDTATGTVNDVSNIYDTYQWAVNKNDGLGYNFVGSTVTVPGFDTSITHTYTAKVALPTPLDGVANEGWTYKLILGTTAADISSPICSYSDSLVLQITNSCNIILPIKLISIKAEQLNANSGEVVWVVGDQLNVNHYELEKSIDGINFSYVTSVTASSNTTTYTADDNDLYGDGVNYYEIKEVDNDGTVHYSKIVTINPAPNTNTAIQIYPNPVVSELYLSKPQNTEIKSALIIDAIGQVVMEVPNFNNITNKIEVNDLPTGFYELKIIDSKNQVTNLKFIKK